VRMHIFLYAERYVDDPRTMCVQNATVRETFRVPPVPRYCRIATPEAAQPALSMPVSTADCATPFFTGPYTTL